MRTPTRERLVLVTPGALEVPPVLIVVSDPGSAAEVPGVRVEGRPVVNAEYAVSIAKRLEFRVSAETEGSGAASKAVRSRCQYVGRRLAVERCEPAAPGAAPSA